MTTESMRVVQLDHAEHGRKVAIVKEPALVLLSKVRSVYELAMTAIHNKEDIELLILSLLSGEMLLYDDIYQGRQSWQLLPSFDHPTNAYACLVSGTGLTHKSSALNRQLMHKRLEQTFTDSMQMYEWGVQNGHPADGHIGAQPEWFYKGTGNILMAHGENLEVPSYATDGGEEPEIAGAYVIDENENPVRVGFTTGNEFSDHVMEKKNYLYLAPSKLRTCAIGPELVINGGFQDINGEVVIERDDNIIWSASISTGENNMAHSLSNIEHHHFKYKAHGMPGQAHVHFFGADAFSYGNKILLSDKDTMSVSWKGFGRPLKNYLKKLIDKDLPVTVRPL